MSNTTLRLLILFVCAAGTLLILQSAFDSSDHRKADHAVRHYTVNGRVFGPWLEARRPHAEWSTEITHGCRGVVRVNYGDVAFDYDVPGHGIHPGNPGGREALEAFVSAPSPSPSLGAPR
jgi:hypothetical protein